MMWIDLTHSDEEVVLRAARSIANSYPWTEVDDLRQTARELVVTRPGLLSVREEPGLLYYRLRRDLVNNIQTESKHRMALVALGQDERPATNRYGQSMGFPSQPTPKGGYDRELVEAIMPAVWDDSYCYGLEPAATTPETGMPLGWKNKAHGNTHWALIADIRGAWKEAPLTLKQKRALFLRYAMHHTEAQIGMTEGTGQGVMSRRITTGIGKIVAHLNGTEAIDYEQEQDNQ